jgi:hypothetical protein
MKRFFRVRLWPWLPVAALLGACATEPDPLDRTQPEAVPKAIFSGTWYYMLTVTDADWKNRFTFEGEQNNTYSASAIKVRWEITQDKLNAFRVAQAYRDKDGKIVENKVGQKSLILSFRIKKHYDIRYRYNSTTREELNVLEENTDRPWNEREYMEVDWSRSLATNIWAPTAQEVEGGSLQRDDVAVYENVDFYARGSDAEHDLRINTRTWDPESDPEVYAINIDTKESITSTLRNWWQLYYGSYQEPTTVRFRHSLLKATPLDKQTYKPLDYRDDMFRRFGFFRTEYEVYDDDRHRPTETQKKYFINRWDLSGQKQIAWYLSPATQQAINDGDTELKTWSQGVIDAYNKVFQQATGRSDRIVVLRENTELKDADGNPIVRADGTKRWAFELGDLRFPMINITFKQGLAQPGGYGPSMPDPDTGEIIHGTVNIYGGWMEWVVQRAMDQYDVASGNCNLDDIKNGRHYNPETKQCNAGDQSPPVDGPVNGNGVATVGGPTEIYSGQARPAVFITPALKTAYWPKADITKPLPSSLPQQVALAKPQLKALYDFERKHPTQIDLRGFGTIAGTQYETQVLPQGNLHSLLPFAQSATDPDVINELSPATRLDPKNLLAAKASMIRGMAVRDEPTMFEPGIHAFVNEMKGKPRAEVEARLRRWIYYTCIMHEMGHTLGLRHNFAGSADRRNFPEGFEKAYGQYWDKVDALRKEYSAKIKAGDAKAYEEYVAKVDAIPSTHERFATSSIMDYVGDWLSWTEPVRPYDRAALLLGYGLKVEVKKGSSWDLADYKQGDFDAVDPLDDKTPAKSGRHVRYYLFCSDEKTFDDAFCTPFDRGTTATEIVRNFIRDSQINYVFRNFKRDSTSFEGFRRSYYFWKWIRNYYMYAKPFAQTTLNSIRYDEFWGSVFDGINQMVLGPESRNMTPGYHRNGGEDLLRASLLFYYHLLYDVLMRPDYGYHQLKRDTSGAAYWESTKEKYLDANKPALFLNAGIGWGFNDYWDLQSDPQRYDVFLRRIGVEVDKVIALEVLSIPMALNDPLRYEKANGNSFWSSLWTNNGVQLWEVVRGMVTDNFSHLQNPWCIKCDAACRKDPKKNPPQLKAYPIDYLEGLGSSGIFKSYPLPTGTNRCTGVDEQPVQPGMDALFAIKPIFYGISGAAHPWYHNALSEKLDSQVKGGNHRFDIPPGAQVAEFVNASGTKTYQAVQTSDKLSISYALVDNGQRIRNRLDLSMACLEGKDSTPFEGKIGTHNRTCADINVCFASNPPDWCGEEGWDSSFALPAMRYHNLDRIEAMLIMMQDMIDIAGHYQWRVPGYLSE